LNGSGRSAKNTSLDQIRRELEFRPGQAGKIPTASALSVTVPGAAAGWVDTVDKFGSGTLTLEQILTPAIELAEQGFPVSEMSAQFVSYLCLTHSQLCHLTSGSGNPARTIFEMLHQIFESC
jgi:gamma-glutamyltranspeptidase/glutathione hydrolase